MTFTMAVTGANAPYSTSFSRFWQPDTLNAPGVTFINYTYGFVATFSSSAILYDGFYINAYPDTITGSFSGEFIGDNGDTYGFMINLSKASCVPLDGEHGYILGEQGSWFGVSAVPEPLSIFLLGTTILGMAGTRKYFRNK